MTIPEAQSLRAGLIAAINAVTAGGIESYTVNGRTVTKLDISKMFDQINDLDALIQRLQGGMFSGVKFGCRQAW